MNDETCSACGCNRPLAQMSAANEADADRIAMLICEDYSLVYVAREFADGDWCVFYGYPKRAAVPQPEEPRP